MGREIILRLPCGLPEVLFETSSKVLLFTDKRTNDMIDEYGLNSYEHLRRWIAYILEERYGLYSASNYLNVRTEYSYSLYRDALVSFEKELIPYAFPANFGPCFIVSLIDPYTFTIEECGFDQQE